MRERKRTIQHLCIAAILLFAVSTYRQLSLLYWPTDVIRPYIVYAAYLFLLCWWQYVIVSKIQQRSMLIHLSAQNAVFIVYLTLRFVQDAFLYTNVSLMRFTGYFIIVLITLTPLLGLYVSFYLGMHGDYRIDHKWYLLLFPAGGIIAFALTNDSHHLVFRLIEGESQPNLYFHPNWGICIVFAWALCLIACQVFVIEGRSDSRGSRSFYRKMIPLYEPVLLLLFAIPYSAASFVVQFELVEFSAGLIFIVIFCWELYMLLGLIPINTQYDEVFRHSTIAMQIRALDDSYIVQAENAADIKVELLSALQKDGYLLLDNTAVYLYKTPDSMIIWQSDQSDINQVVRKLRGLNEQLEQDNDLVAKEISIQADAAKTQARNEIYNFISHQVSSQLMLLKNLLNGDSSSKRWEHISMIGTYIKRYCNLQLILQESGAIPNQDLQIALNDMISCMNNSGISAELTFQPIRVLSPILALHVMEVLEALLERTQFSPTALRIHVGETISYEVSCHQLPFEPCRLDQDYALTVSKAENRWVLEIRQEEA